MISSILCKAVNEVVSSLPDRVKQVPIHFWNESVFRYLLLEKLHEFDRESTFYSEWNRVDVAMESQGEIHLIELKFWPMRSLNGGVGGGPSAKNFAEYEAVVDKLNAAKKAAWAAKHQNIGGAYLILVYADPVEKSRKKSYSSYYGNLKIDGKVSMIHEVCCIDNIGRPARRFTAKLLEIAYAE